MNRRICASVALGAAALAGAASAAQVEIRNAAARVTIIPENRSDVVAQVVRTNARIHLTLTPTADGGVLIDGGLAMRPHNCSSFFGRPGVYIFGVGHVPVGALPQVVVRTPMKASVRAGGAVFGVVGRSDTLDLDASGCGDWKVANVAGAAAIRTAGSGDVHAGSTGSARVISSGSSDVTLGEVRDGLSASIAGSGDLTARSVNGPFEAHVSGSGDIVAHGGQVSDMNVQVSGSGDVRLDGVASTLTASVAGSGDVTVHHVNGAVNRHIAGSGSVDVGR